MTYFFVFIAGAISIIGQVVLFRELINVFSGSELVLVFGLGFLLFSSSLGVYSSKDSSITRAKILFALTAFSFLVLFLFCASLRPFFQTPRGLILPLFKQFASILFILFPFGFICGKLFGELSLLLVKEGSSPSKAYAIDTLGAVTGGVVSFVLSHLGVSQSYFVLVLIFLSVLPVIVVKKIYSNIIRVFIIFVCLFGLSFFLDKIHFSVLKMEDGYLKEVRETPYGRLSISENEGQCAVFFNNSLLFESESVSAEELVHLPLLCVENLKEILILGGVSEGVLKETLKHGAQKIDVVELDENNITLPRKYICDDRYGCLLESSVHLHIMDGRRFLDRSAKYDAILISNSGQGSISENRFFTEDFYNSCFERIKEGGVLAFRLIGAENYQSELLLNRNGSVIKPLFKIFGNVMIFPHSTTLVVAIKGKKVELKDIVKRFEERSIRAKLISPVYIKYLWENQRRKEFEKSITDRKFEQNSDFRPVAYFFTLLLETARDYPKTSFNLSVFNNLKTAFYLFCGFLVMTMLIGKWFSGIGKTEATVFVSGFSGMAIEISIIVYHQMKHGVLYKDIGIITSLFMAGLALGALYFPVKIPGKYRVLYICFLILLTISQIFLLDFKFTAKFVFIAIFCGGFIGGSLFKIAEALSEERRDLLLKKLYFVDLCGGSMGAILTSLFLIPLFGLKSSFVLLAILLLFCL